MQIEHRSLIANAAVPGGAVEVARRIPKQTGPGGDTVVPIREAVQHGFSAHRIQLKHLSIPAAAASAAIDGGAIEVAGLVSDQTCIRICPVQKSSEAVQH